MPVYSNIQTSDQTINRIQNNIKKAFDPVALIVENAPLLSYSYLQDIAIDTTDTAIRTGLGRPYKGFFVVRKRANEDIWESTTSNPAPEAQIILKATALIVVDLWVF